MYDLVAQTSHAASLSDLIALRAGRQAELSAVRRQSRHLVLARRAVHLRVDAAFFIFVRLSFFVFDLFLPADGVRRRFACHKSASTRSKPNEKRQRKGEIQSLSRAPHSSSRLYTCVLDNTQKSHSIRQAARA